MVDLIVPSIVELLFPVTRLMTFSMPFVVAVKVAVSPD